MKDKKKNKFPMILLCTPTTVEDIEYYYNYFQTYISPSRIIVIGNGKVKQIIENEQLPVEYMDEDNLYPRLSFQSVKKAIYARTKEENALKRTGWYFQQFLKMAYSYSIASDEQEYLIWDSDTVPTHVVTMYAENGKRYFDVKTEYHEPYFKTLSQLFPELRKNNDYSFISEHMLVDKNVMCNLIQNIERNVNIDGNYFWEKIINAVDVNTLSESGFSEFETYGTYCQFYYRDLYEIREWKSLREGAIFYGNKIKEENLKYLSKAYDAVSFESHESHIKLQKIFCHKFFQRLIWIKSFEAFKNLLKKIMGYYE